ncbi:MAG: hypothetical protein N2170_08320 [Bacteroidia bacterium]|nr:hypothetical protein [Bacteroidia bacterium]
MRQTTAFLGWWIGFLSLLYAQVREPDPRVPVYRNPVLKFQPLAMIDPFQYTLHLGLELPTSASSSFQLEGGWVFGHFGETEPFGTTEEDFSQTGFKARLQWREYFLSEKPPTKPTYTLVGGYVAFQGGFQYYLQNLGQIDTSGIYPPPSNPMPLGPYERAIQAFSFSCLLGYQAQLGTRFICDLFTGIGVRYTQHNWKPIAPPHQYAADLTPVGDFILRRGGRPIPHIGLSLGWIFR